MAATTPAQVAQRYDQAAERYDALHTEASQRKYRRIESSLRSLLGRGRVLDLGCGTGRLLRKIEPDRGVGVDISREMLRRVPSDLNILCADAHYLPLASESFDTVIAAQGVLRYLDLSAALPEIARVLKPGGRLATHHFGDVFSFRRLTFTESSRSLRDVRDIIGPANQAGFAAVAVELWRPIRIYPFALRVPSWLPRGVWTHCICIFEKTGVRP